MINSILPTLFCLVPSKRFGLSSLPFLSSFLPSLFSLYNPSLYSFFLPLMVTHYHSVVDFETVMCKIVDGDAANMTFSVKLVMRRFRKNESEERVCLHLLQTHSSEIFSLVISRSQSDWQYFHHMYCALLSGS